MKSERISAMVPAPVLVGLRVLHWSNQITDAIGPNSDGGASRVGRRMQEDEALLYQGCLRYLRMYFDVQSSLLLSEATSAGLVEVLDEDNDDDASGSDEQPELAPTG